MSLRARPARPRAPIVVAAAILLIWWLVAHNGGSGWVQALGDVVFGALVVGILGPSMVIARAKVRAVSAPTDGAVGQPLSVTLVSSTRLRVRTLRPPGAEAFVGPTGRQGASEQSIVLLPVYRGVYDSITLDIASAAPFALQWWTRRVEVALPSPLHVAPRRGRAQSLPTRPEDDEGAHNAWIQTDVGQPRGARPYRPGDSRRQVHWGATAHAGELMVRELERPSAEPVTLTVVLPADPREAERVAERAFGTMVALLEEGAPLVLATTEAAGAVVAPVADRRTAGRRLARAVAPRAASTR